MYKSVLASLIFGFTAPFANAQATINPNSDTDSVLVFNRVCYAQVPVIDNIRDLSAELAWQPMANEELKQFTSVESPEVLEGWDVNISQRLFRLGVVQSGLNETFKTSFPDFADGTATTCTLVLDGDDDADVIQERMNLLARKEPSSENVADGELLTTTWSGGNDDFKVFLFMKSDASNKASLLNVTILSKEN